MAQSAAATALWQLAARWRYPLSFARLCRTCFSDRRGFEDRYGKMVDARIRTGELFGRGRQVDPTRRRGRSGAGAAESGRKSRGAGEGSSLERKLLDGAHARGPHAVSARPAGDYGVRPWETLALSAVECLPTP